MSSDSEAESLLNRFKRIAEDFDRLVFRDRPELLRQTQQAIANYEAECERIERFDREQSEQVQKSPLRDRANSPGNDFVWVLAIHDRQQILAWIPKQWAPTNRPQEPDLLHMEFNRLTDDDKLVLLAALHDGLVITRSGWIGKSRSYPRNEDLQTTMRRMEQQPQFDRIIYELCGNCGIARSPYPPRCSSDEELASHLRSALNQLSRMSGAAQNLPDADLLDAEFRIAGIKFVLSGRHGDLLRIYQKNQSKFLNDMDVGELLSPGDPIEENSVRSCRSGLVAKLHSRFNPTPNPQLDTDGTGFFETRTLHRKSSYRLRFEALVPLDAGENTPAQT